MLFGYLTEHQIDQINSVFRKARKWQLTTDEYDIVAIAEKLRYDLFQQSKCVTQKSIIFMLTAKASISWVSGNGDTTSSFLQ